VMLSGFTFIAALIANYFTFKHRLAARNDRVPRRGVARRASPFPGMAGSVRLSRRTG
jgi:hypothetical protein